MTCHHWGAKPLSELMLAYWKLEQQDYIQWNKWINIRKLPWEKMRLKIRRQNCGILSRSQCIKQLIMKKSACHPFLIWLLIHDMISFKCGFAYLCCERGTWRVGWQYNKIFFEESLAYCVMWNIFVLHIVWCEIYSMYYMICHPLSEGRDGK